MASSTFASDLLTSGAFCSSFSKSGQQKSLCPVTPSLSLNKFNGECFNGQAVSSRRNLCISAEYGRGRNGGSGDFLAGFVLGGVVFGALGYLFAPQVSKTVLGSFGGKDELSNNSSKNLEDDEGIEKTRRNLNEKIAQLNSAIDDVSAQLRADDGFAFPDNSTHELESAA